MIKIVCCLCFYIIQTFLGIRQFCVSLQELLFQDLLLFYIPFSAICMFMFGAVATLQTIYSLVHSILLHNVVARNTTGPRGALYSRANISMVMYYCLVVLFKHQLFFFTSFYSEKKRNKLRISTSQCISVKIFTFDLGGGFNRLSDEMFLQAALVWNLTFIFYCIKVRENFLHKIDSKQIEWEKSLNFLCQLLIGPNLN